MKTQQSEIPLSARRVFATLVLRLLALVFLMPGLGLASPLDVQTLTQLMIEDQGAAIDFLALIAGADPTSPLSFMSNVDAAGMAFSFSDPSSTYQGKRLALSGMGTFDPNTNIVTITSSGTLDSISWTAAGTIAVGALAIPRTDDFQIPPIPIFGYDLRAFSDLFPDGTSTYQVIFTRNGQTIGGTRGQDNLAALGQWTFSQDVALGFGIVSTGFSPITGGTGNFTAVVTTPEPSTWLLFATGVLGLLGHRWRRRKQAA